MKNPPHLPPKACRVDTYYRLQNIKWILLFGFLAFIAGGSATLITSAWILPNNNVVNWQTASVISRGSSQSRPELNLEKQIFQRLLTVYDKRKMPDGEFYAVSASLGSAVIVSSDGWAVMAVPNFIPGAEKNWLAVDYQRSSYAIEKVVYEKLNQLVLFKIKAEGLRVVSFPNWPQLSVGHSLWSYGQEHWQNVVLRDLVREQVRAPFVLWQPQFVWRLWEDVLPGSILFSNSGELIGFVSESGHISHSWVIEGVLNSVLSNGTLVYKGWPVTGYYVKGWTENIQNNLNGFYVEKVTGISSLKKGDIILKIQGETISEERLAETLWLAPDQSRVLVWRAGEEIELDIEKTTVLP